MASSHVLKPSLEPVPKMQPAMMMFSSKYWSRRGMSLDSAMFQQQQRHNGGQMVRELHPPGLQPRSREEQGQDRRSVCVSQQEPLSGATGESC